MYQTSPRSSASLSSTTRVEGRPPSPTVASVMALGSVTPPATASPNQALNWASGTFADALSSSSPRS